jgi:hypothetical protein
MILPICIVLIGGAGADLGDLGRVLDRLAQPLELVDDRVHGLVDAALHWFAFAPAVMFFRPS